MPETTVLVIDDEPGVVRLCQRLLERAGFHVLAVTQPQDGLTILEEKRVELLLVDIRMPGADGFQVMDAARRRQPELAVVIMTGFGTVEMAIEALRRGADGLILKPFAGAELVQSVKRALQESQNKRDVARLQAMRPLFDITEALFIETNPDRLQDLLLDAVRGHLRCAHAGIYQNMVGKTHLQLMAWRGDMLSDGDQISKNGLALPLEISGAPLILNREGPGNSELQQYLASEGLSSILIAPLCASAPLNKEDGGLLLAARGTSEPAFREADLEMLVILARQAAAALENARLHTKLRDYIRQVEESQRALIQAEKMATAGRLTASIAHEINNPLQAVQNCLHLAGRQELSPDQRAKYLELAQTELDRLMHTVQRMLDFYRPGALDRKPADLNELARRVLQLVEQKMNKQGVKLQARFSPRLPLVLVVGDQIQQVFLNLVLNALEAMPEGGELVVKTSARRGEAEILFEDTGPGVPPEERKHVFEPFVSTKVGGTGLGLAISYGIIAAHGGSLELLPGRGRGASFRVTLPVGEPMSEVKI